MPEILPEKDIERAARAIEHARQVRKTHRRRTARDSQQRITDIKVAIKRLKEAMRPLRSERGRFQYGSQTDVAYDNRVIIIEIMEQLKRERIKLWKMLPAKSKK